MRGKWIYWFGGWIFDFTKAVVFGLFVILILHFFVFTVIVVSGPSMNDTHHDGDVMFLEKISYWFNSPKRGDVVGIYFPSAGPRRLIKRVIGMPGEEITITKGKVYINGKELSEEYLKNNTQTIAETKITLKSDEYFVMGDNRANSLDSRIYGVLPKSAFVGKKLFFIINFKSLIK